jgi:hypothetical protein
LQLSLDELRRGIRARNASYFDLHKKVSEALTPAVHTERSAQGSVATAIDILFIQAYKSHEAIAILAESGLSEEAATIARRLLEIAVQAVYITADSDAAECDRRAGSFLAHLWSTAPKELKAVLPEPAVKEWEGIWAKYGPSLSRNRNKWGPSFAKMFTEIGRRDTYDEDYAALSSIAHGSPEEFILHFSLPSIKLRSDLHLPAILTFAGRYYLAVAGQWNDHFQCLKQSTIDEIRSAVMTVADE